MFKGEHRGRSKVKGEHPIMYYSDYNRPPEEGQPIETNNFRVSDPEPPRKN